VIGAVVGAVLAIALSNPIPPLTDPTAHKSVPSSDSVLMRPSAGNGSPVALPSAQTVSHRPSLISTANCDIRLANATARPIKTGSGFHCSPGPLWRTNNSVCSLETGVSIGLFDVDLVTCPNQDQSPELWARTSWPGSADAIRAREKMNAMQTRSFFMYLLTFGYQCLNVDFGGRFVKRMMRLWMGYQLNRRSQRVQGSRGFIVTVEKPLGLMLGVIAENLRIPRAQVVSANHRRIIGPR